MSKELVRVVAAVFYRFNQEGICELLMFRRASHNSGAGFWEFPGGKVEDGESEVQALEREIVEELGVRIKVLKLLGENQHAYPTKTILLRAYYAGFLSQQEFVLIDHDAFGWYDSDTIKTISIAHADIPLIDKAFISFQNTDS